MTQDIRMIQVPILLFPIIYRYVLFVHVRTFDESPLYAWTTIGQLFTTIILDTFTPNAHFTFGMKLGNACLTGFWQINANPAIFI